MRWALRLTRAHRVTVYWVRWRVEYLRQRRSPAPVLRELVASRRRRRGLERRRACDGRRRRRVHRLVREHARRRRRRRKRGLEYAERVVDRRLHPQLLLPDLALDVLPRVHAHRVELGRVHGHGPAHGLAFAQIPVFLVRPFTEELGTVGPAILSRDRLGADAVFVRAVWMCAVEKEGKDDVLVAVCGGEMERG